MIDWVPVVLVTFKFLVLGTGMFFAVKWHYDQGRKGKEAGKETEQRDLLRAGGKVAAIFVVALLVLGLVAYGLLTMLGNDLILR